MEITLEKIELVKDRTGVTYAEAKQALEEADGSVVDAIIAIEENINMGPRKVGSLGSMTDKLIATIKDQVSKGNVSRIQVKKDGEIILNVPVNAGIVGVVIAPIASAVGVVAAFGFKCVIEIVKTDGTIIDISDAVTEAVGTVSEKGSEVFESAREKGTEFYAKASEKAGDATETYGDKAEEVKAKATEKAEELKEKVAEKAEELKAKASEVKEEVEEEIEDIEEEISKDDAE